MTAIAGIASTGKTPQVSAMLTCLRHRGPVDPVIVEAEGFTLGAAGSTCQPHPLRQSVNLTMAVEYAGPAHFARAVVTPRGLILERDPLGAAPLYYGWTAAGELCFASEVKALLPLARDIYELPPGSRFDGQNMTAYFTLASQPLLDLPAEDIARELRERLDCAVRSCLGSYPVGSWLSGGLDSSAIAALARAHLPRLHSFVAGLPGAPDLAAARAAADYLHSEHHEVVLRLADLLAALDAVIYHLESFDALLVRSSLTNYLVAQASAEYVPAIFSGEGGDELFAGYAYLKTLDPAMLSGELIDITSRLHNTALQRVDRSSAAHGLTAYTVFLDPDVLDYALRIPIAYKLRGGVEKWILRRALDGLLPPEILDRPKAKFWEGAGVGDLLAEHAEAVISDADFRRERVLPNGWRMNSKEELLYYRKFKEHFGELSDLTWMGRTKGAPVS